MPNELTARDIRILKQLDRYTSVQVKKLRQVANHIATVADLVNQGYAEIGYSKPSDIEDAPNVFVHYKSDNRLLVDVIRKEEILITKVSNKPRKLRICLTTKGWQALAIAKERSRSPKDGFTKSEIAILKALAKLGAVDFKHATNRAKLANTSGVKNSTSLGVTRKLKIRGAIQNRRTGEIWITEDGRIDLSKTS